MSEELKKKRYIKNGEKFGVYEYYKIGETTINSLKTYKIVPNLDYSDYGSNKPDGLIVDRRDLNNNIKVIGVVEYKDTSNFDNISKKKKAVEQCVTYCQILNAKFGVVTDTNDYIWINPNIKKELAEEKYDDFYNKKRYYSHIKNDDGYDLSYHLVEDLRNETDVKKSLKLMQRILNEISESNSQLKKEVSINPKNLAKNVWQSIWLASGENPDMCLSTFVEIFIFRYLSDLDILKKNSSGVVVDFKSVRNSGKDLCLKYYFDNVRPYIKEIFPESEYDRTSIINGFILNSKIKEHNNIFYNVLNNFDDFLKDENGNDIKLVSIEPEFKSRLYEDFLKRSISQKNWGQFFTPRNVVKAIIEISGIENLKIDSIVGDPACGVGGFILEPILAKRSSDYYVDSNELKSKLVYEGLDRDIKVIIMAKANMLIHLSELLRDNPTLTKAFANKINEVFKSHHSSILGSLSITDQNHYDLIMSNPPYVTKGIVNYKKAINDNGTLKDYYKVNGMGVECLFMEKMINGLKPNGTMIIVIPDGILNRVHDSKIRESIKKRCIINSIVSLPIGTFYSTQKKTYIISLTKKEDENLIQSEPVFCYIVSSIGESLDVYRIPTEENDLKDMVKQYKYFMTDKTSYDPMKNRCKLFDINRFEPKTNWCIDRWWTKEEKIELGIEEEINIVNIEEYHEQVNQIIEEMSELNKELDKISSLQF